MKREKELVFNTIVIGIGKFSTQVISFLLLPLYTGILSTTEYGVYDVIMTLSVLLLPIITLLMEESMFRFLIDCKNDKGRKNVITQSILYCLFGLLLFSVIYLAVVLIFDFQYKLLTYLFIVSNLAVALRNALSRGLGRIKMFSASNFFNSLIVVCANVLLIAYFKVGMIGLLLSNIVAGFLTSAFVMFKLKVTKYIDFRSFDKQLMKKMVKYSVPLVPNSVSWTIINMSSRLIITDTLGAATNGIYSVANKFPFVIDTVYNFFYSAWKESAAKTVNDKDSEDFYNLIYKTLENFMWAVCMGMIAVLPFVFNMLIKKDFVAAYIYVPVLILSIYFGNISGFFGGIFSAHKETKIMGTTTIISAAINIILTVCLIGKFGVWAAAFSTLISNIFVYVYRKIKIRKYVTLNSYINPLLATVAVTIVLIGYYSPSLIIKIAVFIVICAYCIFINKEFLKLCYDNIAKKSNK